jgi:hypothetical protein
MHDGWTARRAQFGVLYRVFLMRVVDLELLSQDADTSRLVAQFATVFAGLSLLFSLPMLIGLPIVVAGQGGEFMVASETWTPEHFFIATTMVVAGVMAVLTWDSAFPDRRDVLVLAPLPVRASTLFLAKIAALFAAPGLAVFALNVFSGVLWPALFASGRGWTMLRAWPAYWMSIGAAGVFVFCTLLALQGLAANLLPRQLFLRVSAFLQAGVLCILLSVYFLEPSLESVGALTSPGNQHVLEWLPTYWFLGMFQQLNGSMQTAFDPLARRAWIGLGASVAGAGAALLFSYFRILPKIVEQPDIMPGQRGRGWTRGFGNSLTGAILLFSARTLLRSRQHRMILSFYLGIGLAIMVGYAKTSAGSQVDAVTGIRVGYLVASGLMMVLAILATRVVSTIPIFLQANWIFRITQARKADDYHAAVRVTWTAIGVAMVWTIVAGLMLAAYPWRPVAGHLAALAIVGMTLVELCLYGFRKIPFACSYLPGKANMHVVFWGGLVFLIWSFHEAAKVEGRMLRHLASGGLMILVLLAIAACVRWASEALANPAEELVFEEEYPPVVVTLKLN